MPVLRTDSVWYRLGGSVVERISNRCLGKNFDEFVESGAVGVRTFYSSYFFGVL